MTTKTRLFFVVDSIEENEEIFATKEEAKKYFDTLPKTDKPRMRICIVKNAYMESGMWNYEDLSDTFEDVLTFN